MMIFWFWSRVESQSKKFLTNKTPLSKLWFKKKEQNKIVHSYNSKNRYK